MLLFVNNCFTAVWLCVSGLVPVTSRSCSVATTPNDTPRTTTPLAAIQLSMLPPVVSASLKGESDRQTGDGGHGTAAGHCRTDDQTASDQKRTPYLLPADNFGPCFSA